MTDLASLSLPQLRQLGVKIAKEMDKRQQAGKAGLIKKLTKMVQEHGLSLDDVLSQAADGKPARSLKAAKPAPVTPKQPLPAKFRHPNNKDLAWSGRGRRPQWVEAWLVGGGSLVGLEIAAQKMAKRSTRRPDGEPTGGTLVSGEAVAAG